MQINTDKYFRAFRIQKISDISKSELKRRYRILVKKYHPDHGGNAIHFRFIQDAYNYLKVLVEQNEKIEDKKFHNKNYVYYSNGSIFDTNKNRWIKIKGKIVDVKI